MKVLHINNNYICTTLHQNMINYLSKNGLSNTVYCPVIDKKASIIIPNHNEIIIECFKKWDRVAFNYKQYKIIKALYNNINIKEYNLIHAYTLFTDGNCANRLSKKYDIPYIVAVRNTDVNAFFRLMPHLRSRGVKIMRDARAVCFLSDTYRNQVFEKYIPRKYHAEIESKTYIIPNGIDDFWFNNIPIQRKTIGNEIRLIYAGRIDKNKNIITTQKAINILRKQGYDVLLTVVGKIEDKKEFMKINGDKYTTYISEKSKEELIKLYRKHNIFVMPSYTESFGLVYAEAMSQGLPVVYSAGQGFDGQFPEGKVGYSVDAHSPQDVAEAIIKIIKNYQQMSTVSIECAKKFMWDEIVHRYEQIYKEVEDENEGFI